MPQYTDITYLCRGQQCSHNDKKTGRSHNITDSYRIDVVVLMVCVWWNLSHKEMLDLHGVSRSAKLSPQCSRRFTSAGFDVGVNLKLWKFDQFVYIYIYTAWALQFPSSGSVSPFSVVLWYILITLHADKCTTFSFPWTYLNKKHSTLDQGSQTARGHTARYQSISDKMQ